MKLWEKIFISILLVFQVFFISSSIFLINRSFNSNLDNEINSGISEQNRLCISLAADMYLAKMHQYPDNIQKKFSKEDTDSIVSTYISHFKEGKIFINVTDKNGNEIITNFKVNADKTKKQLHAPLNKVSYVIKDVKGKSYLFIDKKINLNDNDYNISYIKEVSYIYENEKFMFNLLMKLNVFLCITLAAVMIVLSKIITRPINGLIKSTKKISEGNFSERVEIDTDDEIGLLAENFNNMADVIEDKIKALKNVSQDKQRFIDNLAHELRTPLTSIIGYADFLRTNKCDEETSIQSLNYIYSEGKRLESLSSKLMDLIILKKENLDIKKVNVKELLYEIRSRLTPKLKESTIDLKIVSGDFYMSIDKELMIILISNLVDNSIKASKSGDEIHLKAYMDEDPIIEVEDMGVGISKADMEKIFEPFYMVDKSRDRRNNGAGLGLALCSKIAEIHDAKIHVESELGKGTKIKLRFVNNCDLSGIKSGHNII
ncbi:ATP-binding protein [Clostridium sp. MT-14]|uniref:sensor histidine kinase n=1 Tax=Clostridium sp. MT-14 TaxID=3348360 RepID=UPI0035F2E6B9